MRNLDLIVGISMVIYSIIINFMFGRITFNETFFSIGIILITYHYLKNKLKYYINSFSKGKFIINSFKYLITFILLIFIITEVAIVVYPKKDISSSEYVIVLGAGVMGTRPGLTLKHRLESTIKYYLISIKDMVY